MKSNLSETLNVRKDLRRFLFPKGFLLTSDKSINANEYPFYGLWKHEKLSGYSLLIHSDSKYSTVISNERTFLLIGHAYEPVISLEHSEQVLLEKCAGLYHRDEKAFTEYFNLWSGSFALFIIEKDGSVKIYGDPSGMQMIFYGFYEGRFYASSHTNLLGDVCGIEQDDYIKRLVGFRRYQLFGKSLPGDLSPYSCFKRIIPNHKVIIKDEKSEVCRFFPTADYGLCDCSYDQIISKAANILKNSMALIPKKWNRAAISLTGGCDSKTTLSCTTENFDKYSYFSYTSQNSEKVDADAAAKICGILSIPHKIHEIPEKDEDYTDLEEFRKILAYNSGSIGKNNANDIRKRIYFANTDDFDVEVKSWVSEITRAYYHKRFCKKKFPKKLTPKYATSLYKVFITERRLVRETSAIFADFLERYYTNEDFDRIPWYDLFFWEFRVSSWNGLNITGEQRLSYDITIPYNNRELLRLLLSTPVEYRIDDKPHKDIVRAMNPVIARCGISVTNVKHTQKRALFEKFYLNISSKLPF